MDTSRDISLKEVLIITREWVVYLFTKWLFILIMVVAFGFLGILYATYQKPVYIAEITFAPEYDNAPGMGAGGYLGLASQFGIDLNAGGGIFEGENLVQLLKSKMLIKRTLLSPALINNKKQLLIDYYIEHRGIRKQWDKDPALKSITFTTGMQPALRVRDSIIKKIVEEVRNSLTVEKINKNLDLIVARVADSDEYFAKAVAEQLVANGISYYVDYRVKKSRENVAILQRQTDSVENLVSGNIVSLAASSDLNVNPIKQIVRTKVQRKQVDLQVTSQIYGELLKQLELAKISLRKETPLIQIIDEPILPLAKKKLGRFKGALLFGIVGFLLSTFYFVGARLILPAKVYTNAGKEL